MWKKLSAITKDPRKKGKKGTSSLPFGGSRDTITRGGPLWPERAGFPGQQHTRLDVKQPTPRQAANGSSLFVSSLRRLDGGNFSGLADVSIHSFHSASARHLRLNTKSEIPSSKTRCENNKHLVDGNQVRSMQSRFRLTPPNLEARV